MESIASVKDILLPNDYLVKMDLKDAYLSIPIHKEHRKYLRCQWKGQNYQFRSLPFGLASALLLKTTGNTNPDVLGRSLDHGTKPRDYPTTSEDHCHTCPQTGVHHQLEEVQSNTHEDIRVSRSLVEFRDDDNFPPRGQADKDSEGVPSHAEEELRISQTAGTDNRTVHFYSTGSSPSSASLPEPPKVPSKDPEDELLAKSIRCINAPPTGSQFKEDLTWWVDKIHIFIGKTIIRQKGDLVIESDASRTGWGAFLRGLNSTAGGLWSEEDTRHHIN